MTTNCTCTVTTCLHNHDNCCCKSDILVDGRDASTKDSTSCASFDKRSHESCTCTHETADPSLRIECRAIKCVYNENQLCTAKNVDISGRNASDSGQTECSTFQAKSQAY